MPNDALTNDLLRATRGDLDSFRRLATHSQVELIEAAQTAGDLILEPRAVRDVVTKLALSQASPETVSRWAGLMRWGDLGMWKPDPLDPGRWSYAPPTLVPAIPIEYSPTYSDEIAQVLVRLSEIGEEGLPDRVELDAFIASLQDNHGASDSAH